MGRIWICIVVALLVVAISGQAQSQAPLDKAWETPCLKSTELNNEYTPLHLYPAARACIESGKTVDAAFLLFLASAYGYFDSLRVADESAHQAVPALFLQTIGAADAARLQLVFEYQKKMKSEPEMLRKVCDHTARIGPPSYRPTYMIEHGMSRFIGDARGDGMVPDFDPATAWEQALDMCQAE